MQGGVAFTTPGQTPTRFFDIYPAGLQRLLEFALGMLMRLKEHHLYATVDAGFAVTRRFNCIKRSVGILRRCQALYSV